MATDTYMSVRTPQAQEDVRLAFPKTWPNEGCREFAAAFKNGAMLLSMNAETPEIAGQVALLFRLASYAYRDAQSRTVSRTKSLRYAEMAREADIYAEQWLRHRNEMMGG